MISVTEKAAEHIKDQLHQRGRGIGIRLGVKTTGCSGLAYVIEFADSENEDDNVFLDKGIKLIINPLKTKIMIIIYPMPLRNYFKFKIW